MKTEKQKMLAGEIYDANNDPALIGERLACKKLCRNYNSLEPDSEECGPLMRRILGSAGSRFVVEQPFYCDYGWNISIGENFYSNVNLVILDEAPVKFGDNCVIGAGSVVTRDIPANSIAVGNPCSVVKKIGKQAL